MIAGGAAGGPKYGDDGMLLSFSVLGPVEEFAEAVGGATAGAADPADPALLGGSAWDEGDGGGLTHPLLGQLDASEAMARRKNESASQRLQTAESLALAQTRTWDRQMHSISKKMGVPKSALMMGKTAEYRERVQQRVMVEALRRRQYPYGGDRAWQIGLRAGGVFYEAIGNPSNGLFCPFRAPNDAEALAKASALALEKGSLSAGGGPCGGSAVDRRRSLGWPRVARRRFFRWPPVGGPLAVPWRWPSVGRP